MMKIQRGLFAVTRRSGSAEGTKGLKHLSKLSQRFKTPILYVRKFSFKEIKKATDRFSMIMGSDSKGIIYRARFSDGVIMTIRKVKYEEQGKVPFPTEVQLLARLNHRHLVKLVGFSEGRERYLAFQHMENGSLRDWLHDPLKTPLNWRTRLQIAVSVAAALEYVYYFCDPPVYNVTINTNNVMLDRNFVAKLSNVAVMDGIRDLDCNNNLIANELKDKLDQRNKDAVFEFGVLILELITGQSMGGEDEPLRWVQGPGIANSMHKMVDADLGGNYDSRELGTLLIIARLCTKIGGESVVSIPQILRYLQGKLELMH